ncbi:3-dehydroquinate synthase [Patescibacteria group bacterium]
MKTIKVNLKSEIDNSYPIFVEKGCHEKIPAYLKKHKVGVKYAIITDSKVKKLYANQLHRLLKKHGIESEIFVFPNGEKSKNIATIEKLAELMISKKFDRNDAIIALGGGVVGDMAGFLASIYMRGIPFVQIPTTLLAMVDSSVGGKTGIDLKSGKNLLGTFYQPEAVFMDSSYLKTLSPKQIKNGLAEVIKYGIIKDKNLFNFIEQKLKNILILEEKTIETIIIKSIKIKSKIVEEDEKESGLRMILNYGHSYGHAIEKMSNYKLLHGYAISIGMVMENKIAVEKKIMKGQEEERIKKLLKNTGLPVITMKKPTKKDLLSDKKKQGNQLSLILPTKIGKVIIKKINL